MPPVAHDPRDQQQLLGLVEVDLAGRVLLDLDPFDAATEDYWRQHFGFRASLTKRSDADGQQRNRLWLPLFSET